MVGFYRVLLAVFISITGCQGQNTFGAQYLKLEKTIPLPGVKGRIDHLDFNLKDQVVYVAALGNNTLEAVGLQQTKVIHSIKGLDEPQGVVYIPKNQQIFVANGGSGDCYFYNARTFEKTATVHFPSDADDVRYDPTSGKVYVGYGNGGIAAIDATTFKQTADIKFTGHPEGFQVDPQTKKIWVNVPNSHHIAVLDGKGKKVVSQWSINNPSAYFPMAFDRENHRLIIGCRRPERFLILDSETGKKISELPCAGDADDLFYDKASKRILISGGSGFIDIFQQKDANAYTQIAHLPSRSGARTSLWVSEWHELLLAAPTHNGHPAAILVYKMQN